MAKLLILLAAAVACGGMVNSVSEYSADWTMNDAATSTGGFIAQDVSSTDMFVSSLSWAAGQTKTSSVVVTRRMATGSLVWTKTNTKNVTLGRRIAVAPGLVVVGGYAVGSQNTVSSFLWCLNPLNGNTIWQQSLAGTTTGYQVRALSFSSDNQHLYATGQIGTTNQGFLAKISTTTGSFVHNTRFTNSDYKFQDIAVDTSGRIILSGCTTNGSAVASTDSAFVVAFKDNGSKFVQLWSAKVLPTWSGKSVAMSISVRGGNASYVISGTAYSGTAPVVFYSTVSSMGKVMYHTVGQYGTAVSVLNVDDYQGMDGPYVIGVHGPTRFFIYKYSTLMGKIDRFLSPALGTVLTTVRLPTAAFLATTKTASRLSPSAIYVTGTETKNGVETAYVQKLNLVDNCHMTSCDSQHGQCVDYVNASACSCQPGFGGADCSQSINECASSPCQNGATCQDQVNSFKCVCATGFSGPRCQVNINSCKANTCVNGNCRDTTDGFVCVCQTGWTGLLCAQSVDDCRTVSCGPGTCVDGHISYKCTCPVGFTGLHCQTNINECASNPCLNSGVCHDGINMFTCACRAGTHQPVCRDMDNACTKYPCANGGQCTDKINGFTCTCAPGYTGVQCETLIDTCLSHACKSGATCVNQHGRFYTCKCPPGVTGRLCDVDVNECASSPCQNGGTCLNKAAMFVCQCPGTHTGTRCDVAVTTAAPAVTTPEVGDPPNVVSVENAEEVVDQVIAELANSGDITEDTINNVADRVTALLLLKGASRSSQEKALTAVDTILSASRSTLSGAQAAAQGLSVAMEGFGGAVLDGKADGDSFSMPLERMAVGAKRVSPTTFTGFRMGVFRPPRGQKGKPFMLSNSTSVRDRPPPPKDSEGKLVDFSVPQSIINGASSSVMNLILYDDDKLFRPSTSMPTSRKIVSPVVAMNVSGIDSSRLADNVNFSLAHTECAENMTCNYTCVFWDYKKVDWNTKGCTMIKSDVAGQITCKCSHLTNFAILGNFSPKKHAHTETLSIITLVGGIISMIGLGLTITVIGIFKKLRGLTAMKITFCFSASMFLALLFFLVGAESTKNKSACISMAALIHYFVLATICWSLVMAINLYRNLVTVFSRKTNNLMNYYHLIGWGAPLVPVLIALLAEVAGNQGVYSTTDYCWFEKVGWYIGTFIVEMAVIWVTNIIVFILVLRTLNRKSLGKYEMKKGRAQTKINLTIFNQLSLVWVFAFLILATRNTDAQITFEYLFAIFTTLQGLGVFVLCVLMNREIRNTVRDTAISSGWLSSSTGSTSSGNTKSTSVGGASRLSRWSRMSRSNSNTTLNKKFSSISRKDSLKSNGSGKSGENPYVTNDMPPRCTSSLNRKDSFGTSTLGRHNEAEEAQMVGIPNPHFSNDSNSDSSSLAST